VPSSFGIVSIPQNLDFLNLIKDKRTPSGRSNQFGSRQTCGHLRAGRGLADKVNGPPMKEVHVSAAGFWGRWHQCLGSPDRAHPHQKRSVGILRTAAAQMGVQRPCFTRTPIPPAAPSPDSVEPRRRRFRGRSDESERRLQSRIGLLGNGSGDGRRHGLPNSRQ